MDFGYCAKTRVLDSTENFVDVEAPVKRVLKLFYPFKRRPAENFENCQTVLVHSPVNLELRKPEL